MVEVERAMPPHKSHHYVPQFYLRNFGTGNSISLFNIRRQRHIAKASIPGQCQRDYLYGENGVVEAALMDMERVACASIAKIIATESVPSDTSDEFMSLIAFVAFQHGRTPQSGEVLDEISTRLSRSILKMPGMVPDDLQDAIKELKATSTKPALRSLAAAASTSHALLDLSPVLLVNESQWPFITSDSPVVFVNPWCRGWKLGGVTGFAASGLQIYVPLSPRHLFVLVDPRVYAVSGHEGRVRVERYKDVKGLNAIQLLTAEANLYYNDTSEARSAINDLPLHWHRDRLGAVRLHRAVAETETSQLVHIYQQQPDVGLDLSFIRVRREKRGIPLAVRARSYREEAMAAERFFRGNRDQSVSQGMPTDWRVIDSE